MDADAVAHQHPGEARPADEQVAKLAASVVELANIVEAMLAHA